MEQQMVAYRFVNCIPYPLDKLISYFIHRIVLTRMITAKENCLFYCAFD